MSRKGIMMIEERINEIERLSDEYMTVTRSIDKISFSMNVIWHSTVKRLAPDFSLDSQLTSEASLAVLKNDSYVEMLEERQSLEARRDEITKELELHRWRLLNACLEKAALFPLGLFTSGLMGEVKH